MFIIDPCPFSIMAGMANLLANTILLTLTAMTWSQSVSETSKTVPLREMPTLLFSYSTLPYLDIAASTIDSQSEAFVTSAWNTDATPFSS